MTKQAVLIPTSQVRMDWKLSLGKLEVGDKLLVKHLPQTAVGGMASVMSRNGKKFVSRKVPQGIYVIRIA